MTDGLVASGPFTSRDSEGLRARVDEQLTGLSVVVEAWASGANLLLAGSFARGEACAWMEGDALVALSDLDLFLELSSLRSLAGVRALSAQIHAALPRPPVLRVDLNLLPPGRGDPSRSSFVLHALHEASTSLLACAPGLVSDWRRERYRLNRTALTVLRAAWNLDAPRAVYALRDCREPLCGTWGERLEAPLRDLLMQALDENPGLGLAGLGPESRGEHPRRWAIARELVERLHERWTCSVASGGAEQRATLRLERAKGLARLALAGAVDGRTPRVTVDVHRDLIEARRALALAVCPAGRDPAWVERGVRALSGLGLGPRRWPGDPGEAWTLAARRSALPNPLRIVLGP